MRCHVSVFHTWTRIYDNGLWETMCWQTSKTCSLTWTSQQLCKEGYVIYRNLSHLFSLAAALPFQQLLPWSDGILQRGAAFVKNMQHHPFSKGMCSRVSSWLFWASAELLRNQHHLQLIFSIMLFVMDIFPQTDALSKIRKPVHLKLQSSVSAPEEILLQNVELYDN